MSDEYDEHRAELALDQLSDFETGGALPEGSEDVVEALVNARHYAASTDHTFEQLWTTEGWSDYLIRMRLSAVKEGVNFQDCLTESRDLMALGEQEPETFLVVVEEYVMRESVYEVSAKTQSEARRLAERGETLKEHPDEAVNVNERQVTMPERIYRASEAPADLRRLVAGEPADAVEAESPSP